jgi:hypothetical protein
MTGFANFGRALHLEASYHLQQTLTPEQRWRYHIAAGEDRGRFLQRQRSLYWNNNFFVLDDVHQR